MSKTPTRAYARIGGITAGVGVLFVGGVLMASSPAFADNGPHVSMSVTSTTSPQNTVGGGLGGGCASCHRAHSAQATTDLLNTSDEVALCTSCHGGTGNGASTDVMDGVGYNGTTGALRGGGFTNAAIDSSKASRTSRGATTTSIDKPLNVINALATPATSSSQHNLGLPATNTMWGNGAFSTSATYGKAGIALECSSCHDPHGNGNFRILKAVPTDSGVTLPTIASASASGNVITYNLVAAYPLNKGQTISVTGNDTPNYNVTKATIASVTGVTPADGSFKVSSFTVSVSPAPGAPVVTGAGGTVTPVFPDVDTATTPTTTVTSAAWTATTGSNPAALTFTVPTGNPIVAGQTVTVSGNTNADFNVSGATVVSATATTFVVRIAGTPAATSGNGGTATGLATAGYNYTTTNYWKQDPNNQAPANALGVSSFIGNASQWCSTCHTRYLSTGSAGRSIDTGDAVFRYRHTSANSAGQDNPNCLQCHVAHGSNAAMNGTSNTSAADSPAAAPNGDHSSKLLRVNNRGVCQLCHNK